MAHDRIRVFNKHIFNKLTLRLAGKSRTPLAVVQHTGRRSGKPYETPIIVEPFRGGFMIALTYGSEVDWYRNVLASDGCVLLWHRKAYTLRKPQPVNRRIALPAFPLPLRLILRLLGTSDFVQMERVVAIAGDR